MSFKIILGALFILLIASVGILGVMAYKSNKAANGAHVWVDHSWRVVEETDLISSSFQTVQLESHAFLIRPETAIQQSYEEAKENLTSSVRKLKSLKADNPAQLARISNLETLLQDLTTFTDSVFHANSTPVTEKLLMARIEKNAGFRKQLHQSINRVREEEKILLTNRQVTNQEIVNKFNTIFVTLLSGVFILIGSTFISIRYNFNRLIKAEAAILNALNKETELSKLKSNFISLASHEFRTPLTAIFTSASLLENYGGSDNKDKVTKHLSRIKSSVSALTGILDEFLSLTRIEEGKMEPKLEQLNVEDLFLSISASLKSFTKPGQVIEYSHSGSSTVMSDPVLLTNIVTNLVSNAIKYSPDNSSISVLSEVNHQFTITVADRGIGIPKSDQDHLFSRFYRASNAGNVQGTGLGLHITKHFVDILGGSIDLSSAVGAGTTVKVVFAEITDKK